MNKQLSIRKLEDVLATEMKEVISNNAELRAQRREVIAKLPGFADVRAASAAVVSATAEEKKDLIGKSTSAYNAMMANITDDTKTVLAEIDAARKLNSETEQKLRKEAARLINLLCSARGEYSDDDYTTLFEVAALFGISSRRIKTHRRHAK